MMHRELIELLRERGLLLLDAAQHPRDVADLGRHARRRHDDLATTACHLRVHVRHVQAVAERNVGALDRVQALGDGRALARESRLLDLQRRRDEDPTVGWDLVAGLEADDVTRHELLGRYFDQFTVPSHAGRHDQHLPQRGDALGCLALLVQPHHGVDDGETDDDQTCRDFLEGDDADHRRTDEHQLHEVAVLPQEGFPAGLLCLLGELVRAIPRPALGHLGGAQTDCGIDLQPLADLIGRQAIPIDLRLGRWGCRRRRHDVTPALTSCTALILPNGGRNTRSVRRNRSQCVVSYGQNDHNLRR